MNNELITVSITEEQKSIVPSERDLRFIYVYGGKISLTTQGDRLILEKDDFCAVGAGEKARYEYEKPGFAGVMCMKYSLIIYNTTEQCCIIKNINRRSRLYCLEV